MRLCQCSNSLTGRGRPTLFPWETQSWNVSNILNGLMNEWPPLKSQCFNIFVSSLASDKLVWAQDPLIRQKVCSIGHKSCKTHSWINGFGGLCHVHWTFAASLPSIWMLAYFILGDFSWLRAWDTKRANAQARNLTHRRNLGSHGSKWSLLIRHQKCSSDGSETLATKCHKLSEKHRDSSCT